MPLRGYHRVGGPNATLTEMGFGGSGGGVVLIYGTFIRTEDTSRYENDYLGQPHWMPYSTSFYADGLGGEYSIETWGLQYLPAGWVTGTGTTPHYIYVSEASSNVEAGSDLFWYVEDGTGINYATGPQSAYSRPPHATQLIGFGNDYETEVSYTDGFSGNSVTIGTGVIVHNYAYYNAYNSSEYEVSNEYVSGQYYPDGTYIADQPDTYQEVPSGSGNTYFDGNDNRTEWDGNGNAVFRYSGLYGYGTFITTYGDYNYYWDGSGGFYGEYVGGGSGYPSYGSPTGNTSGGTNYITINGFEFTNGSYSSTEYNDGNGGTYWDTSYSYLSYDTAFYGDGTYEYRSDGNGGWFSVSVGSGGGGGCGTGPTGNTTTETAYVWISELGNDYPAGTRHLTEYYNEDCTTCWNLDYVSYSEYGSNIAYDPNNDRTFFSDGNGGYYFY